MRRRQDDGMSDAPHTSHNIEYVSFNYFTANFG